MKIHVPFLAVVYCIKTVKAPAQPGNVHISTTSRTTKPGVNGALATHGPSTTLSVNSGPVAIGNAAHSPFRFTGTTAGFIIAGSATSDGSTALAAGIETQKRRISERESRSTAITQQPRQLRDKKIKKRTIKT